MLEVGELVVLAIKSLWGDSWLSRRERKRKGKRSLELSCHGTNQCHHSAQTLLAQELQGVEI